ncbi:hypothetical protein C5S39_07470 [Candidatus Methanophagaceae archaeon]|nr:hypothetical protein C5S39_07470 [Methanophagales archaeon]
MLGRMNAAITIISGSRGIARNTSMIRIRKNPNRSKYPERRPRTVPITGYGRYEESNK